MNKQQLANKIWESANKMRSKIEANEYKDYILGFIFYKFLSDQEVRFLKKEDWEEEDMKSDLNEDNTGDLEFIRKNQGYFISYKNLFSTWLTMGKDFDVSNVRDALSAFNRLISPTHKKVFEKIFDTLETGLSKLGESAASQTKSVSDLIQLIKDIPMDGKQDYDVLGFIYEYLISNFAANAGKKAGEFYTPHEVSLLMSEIVAWNLRDRKEIKIYDPTSGSGSLLINIGKTAAKHIGGSNNIEYYAQELKQNTYNLTRMNLVMRGIRPSNIVTRNGDTLEQDWPYFDESDPEKTYNPLYVDAVVSNPPYSQQWNPEGKDTDPRYSRFGLAPKSKADYAFLLHDLYHLKPDGVMTIVLPHGVLFRGGEEGAIRKNLIEENHIDAIIGLPANIFFGTGIPTIIMVLKQKRENTDVLIIDASKGFEKVGKNNKLRSSDIKRITDTFTSRTAIEKFSKKVSREEIRANDYNLNIPRYVDSSEKEESYDIYASMFGGVPNEEINELNEYWHAFPGLKEALFTKNNDAYSNLAADDIAAAVTGSKSVQKFAKNFTEAFNTFDETVQARLLKKCQTLNIAQEETAIADDIFARLEKIPIVDRYEAYQILDDTWAVTSADIEMIQTEGIDAVRKVDPLMVMKKVKGVDQEVQDGCKGHIIPFELVQKTILKDEASKLESKQNELDEVQSGYSEILDSLSEEEKSCDTVNDDASAFVNAAVVKAAKQYRADMKAGTVYDKDSYEAKIISVDELLAKEKNLKKEISTMQDSLTALTKKTIENLSKEQVAMLLKEKWINPLESKLLSLSDSIISTLCDKIKTLSEKYKDTFSSVEAEIASTSKELSDLIDNLTGSEYDMQGLKEFKQLIQG
jgi:type I restriction enzyme M protein